MPGTDTKQYRTQGKVFLLWIESTVLLCILLLLVQAARLTFDTDLDISLLGKPEGMVHLAQCTERCDFEGKISRHFFTGDVVIDQDSRTIYMSPSNVESITYSGVTP